MRRLYVVLLLLIAGASLAFVLSPAPSASAATVPVRFGIGDQHAAMFDDPRWQAMGLEITRYNVPWDAADDPVALSQALDFVHAARDHGVQVLMQITGRTYDGVREPLPTRAEYRAEVKPLLKLFRPLGVNTWGVWNEANHPTEATFGRPDRAAQFFLELHDDCSGCTINALDLLTQGTPRSKGVASYRGYTQRFFAALGKKASLVKVIGIHNYGELITAGAGASISRDLTTYARHFAPRTRFWITESGGIASNRSRTCDLQRQKAGDSRMFSHAAALHKNGVDRLYAYNWTADDCGYLFDSGLINPDGTARPALAAIEQGAKHFAR